MIPIRYTSQFKKDIKRIKKRGNRLDKIKTVIDCLSRSETLPPKYKDHSLIGNLKETRECHIEPDWLLIYKLEEDELILVRTGTHSDLFG